MTFSATLSGTIANFAVVQPDGSAGEVFVIQDVGVGHGVAYDPAPAGGLPVDAPAFLLARQARGR